MVIEYAPLAIELPITELFTGSVKVTTHSLVKGTDATFNVGCTPTTLPVVVLLTTTLIENAAAVSVTGSVKLYTMLSTIDRCAPASEAVTVAPVNASDPE